MTKKIIAVSYILGKEPQAIEINNNLEAFQDFVNGYIQIIPLDEDLCLICNECGIVDKLPYQEEYKVFGDFLIAKTEEDYIVTMENELVEYVKENIYNLLYKIL